MDTKILNNSTDVHFAEGAKNNGDGRAVAVFGDQMVTHHSFRWE